MLEDIAILTGGKADLRGPGHPARERHARPTWAGPRRSRSTRTTRRSSRAPARSDDIKGRIEQIQRELGQVHQRLRQGEARASGIAKLSGGVAKINVGAATESEMKEKKARVEDAMHATRAAIQEGILPGGGVALLRAADGLKPKGLTPRRGDRLQHRRPRLPVADHADRRERRRGRRRGRANKVLESKGELRLRRPPATRYATWSRKASSTRPRWSASALQNAASVATLLLTSDALVAEMPKDEKKGGGGRRRRRHVLRRLEPSGLIFSGPRILLDARAAFMTS